VAAITVAADFAAMGGALVELPFIATDDRVAAGEPTECFKPVAVVMRAEALSRKEGHVGAVAFRRTGDPATSDFGDAKVIRKFGDLPDDLSKRYDPQLSRASRPKIDFSPAARIGWWTQATSHSAL